MHWSELIGLVHHTKSQLFRSKFTGASHEHLPSRPKPSPNLSLSSTTTSPTDFAQLIVHTWLDRPHENPWPWRRNKEKKRRNRKRGRPRDVPYCGGSSRHSRRRGSSAMSAAAAHELGCVLATHDEEKEGRQRRARDFCAVVIQRGGRTSS
jgi:hypothetical protein